MPMPNVYYPLASNVQPFGWKSDFAPGRMPRDLHWAPWVKHEIDHFPCYCEPTEFCVVEECTFAATSWILPQGDEYFVDVEVLHVDTWADEDRMSYFTYEITVGTRESGPRVHIRGGKWAIQADASDEAKSEADRAARIMYGMAVHDRVMGFVLQTTNARVCLEE